jgi:hypothetical protein
MSISSVLSSLPNFGAKTLQDIDASSIQDGRRLGGSARQFVRFFNKTCTEIFAKKVKINEKTGATTVLETGSRPVTREFVEIITPGDKNVIETHAEDFHKRENFRQYQAFREGRVAPLGKSIDDCTYISAPVATELRILGVHTEEQLADASEVVLGRLPDGFALREFARESVKVNQLNSNNPAVAMLQSELSKAMEMIRELQANKNAVEKTAKIEEPTEEVKEKENIPSV